MAAAGPDAQRVHLSAEQRGDRRPAALVGNVEHLDARGAGEHFIATCSVP
jgi:hypothetical protein